MNTQLESLKRIGHCSEPLLNSARCQFELPCVDEQLVILGELEKSLSASRLRQVYFADRSSDPPPLAYVTHFPRLSVPLEGCHPMELARCHRIESIRPTPGEVVFVPGNAWNKPDWSTPAKVLNIGFAANQMEVTLVHHDGKSGMPSEPLKISIQHAPNGITQPILNALTASGADGQGPPLDRLLAESLLHSCIRLLKNPPGLRQRKAAQTYEAICLYVQQDFQNALTREAVASRFGLAPNHVSRLFRQEGSMSFIDYLNMVRVSRAKVLLREYGLPLKAIATTCGYHDTAYFCRVFKRICKVTPTDFRSHHLDEIASRTQRDLLR